MAISGCVDTGKLGGEVRSCGNSSSVYMDGVPTVKRTWQPNTYFYVMIMEA